MKRDIYLIILMLISLSHTNSYSSEALSDILQEAEDIATESKLNIKDMPSAITVLREDDFEKVGAKNLFEALALISGVELSMLSNGWLFPVIRGQRSAFLSGFDKIKFFIDGIAVNDTTRGTSHFYLNFPIELIDRIEVFRGGNSALYGSGAYSGAIHIITKTKTVSNNNNIFISSGSGNRNRGGANYSLNENGLSLKFDVYYQKEDNQNDSTPVTLDSDKGEFEINSGKSDESINDYSIGIYAKKDNFSIYTRLKNQKSGNYFGIYEILEDNPQEQNQKSFLSEFEYKNTISFGDLTFKSGINIFENKAMFEVVPKEFGYYNSSAKEIPNNGLLSGNNYKDKTLYFDTSFKFKKFYNNDLKIGVKKEYIKSIENEYLYNKNFEDEILKGIYIKPNSEIDKLSLYLQNIYEVNENFDISLFTRFDNYKKYKSQYSLQIGGIYRINDEFKIKSVFNRAYRLPSWSEQLTSALSSEKSKGIEASLIYENILKTTSLQINVFSYTLTDTIDAYSVPSVTDSTRVRDIQKRNVNIDSVQARLRGINTPFTLKDEILEKSEILDSQENLNVENTDIEEDLTEPIITTTNEIEGIVSPHEVVVIIESDDTSEVGINIEPTLEPIIDSIPTEEVIIEPIPTEEVIIEPIPTEDNIEEPIPTEEVIIEPIPTEDNIEEPIPTEDNIEEPIPTEEVIIDSIPTENNIEEPIINEDIEPTETNIEIENSNTVEVTDDISTNGVDIKTEEKPQEVKPDITQPINNNNNNIVVNTNTTTEDDSGVLPTITSTPTQNETAEEIDEVVEDTPQEISSLEYFFKNINKIRTTGIEIEYSHSLNRKNHIDLSYSLVKLENSQSATYLPDSTQTLIKGVYTYSPMPNLRFHTFVNYRGEIEKDLHSNEIKSFVSLDENIVWQQNANNYYSLSIKNLLNKDIRYNSITGLQPNGLKRDGRVIFFSYKYQF